MKPHIHDCVYYPGPYGHGRDIIHLRGGSNKEYAEWNKISREWFYLFVSRVIER